MQLHSFPERLVVDHANRFQEFVDSRQYQSILMFQHIHAEPCSFHQVTIVAFLKLELNKLTVIVQGRKQLRVETEHSMIEILKLCASQK